jgi:hypothetical protein
MKNTIRQILKEHKQDKFINFIVSDLLKGVAFFRNFEEYESANDMRDYGWDGEMLEFAYNNYEDYGFKQDPEDEGVYSHKGGDYIWDIDEMLFHMFYIFIEEKVKEGILEETDYGWREWKDRWDVVLSDGSTHVWEYDCEYKTYKKITTDSQIMKTLKDKYAITEGDVFHKIVHELGMSMLKILKSEKKLCH